MSEKERLLAVATPEKWDCWLSKNADYLAIDALCNKRDSCGGCSFASGGTCNATPEPMCLFCLAFDDSCKDCVGSEKALCLERPWNERVDIVIARLEKAGIWED